MTTNLEATPAPLILDAPNHPDLAFLHELWLSKRGGRKMPSRADLDPTTFARILPAIVLLDVGPDRGSYTVRLVGEGLVEFFGHSTRGKPAGSDMRPEGQRAFVTLLDLLMAQRAPMFRSGRTWWARDKAYKTYEACFLPLSADGETINLILGGVKFGGMAE
jgi:hypothetical protein